MKMKIQLYLLRSRYWRNDFWIDKFGQKNQKVIGFPALKGDFLAEEITPYVKESEN